ncbi:hypothetical protein [Caballeronia sp. LZ034LL]|uniref:hypothetical protein n=1 Tax=Caballeronia sp. LZ034LL TaxID=3038567 RepID=UPI00286612BF|nr:hypothetical protein [Caballeronia sp. LZ034LL]MDR5839378.1 hypothetical protein [Caballeronia sp. LZ034LL]
MPIHMAHSGEHVPLHFINKQGPDDHTYLSWFKGEKVVIYAPALYPAKQLALAHFKPSKKDEGLVAVELKLVSTNPASVAPEEGLA